MSATLQDRVRSFRINLELLAVSPGYVDIHDADDARAFYEGWAKINRECISAGDRGAADDCSFVAEQLDRLLANFPKSKTTIGVLEVFPLCPQSAFLFGSYISGLERVAKAVPTPA